MDRLAFRWTGGIASGNKFAHFTIHRKRTAIFYSIKHLNISNKNVLFTKTYSFDSSYIFLVGVL